MAMAKAEEKVYVAVGREVEKGRAMLLWVLNIISKEHNKIVLVHVHRPARMIPTRGRKLPAILLTKQELKTYRQLEREKMHTSLDDYLVICSQLQVQAEQVVIQMDDVVKGLLELIARFGITKLVMGAAADKHYTEKMEMPKSKSAISLKRRADPSCNIWFVCKGHLICTRDAGLAASGSLRSPVSSPSSMSAQSEHLKKYLSQGQGGSLNRPFNTMQDLSRHISRSDNFDSHGGETMAAPAEPVKASIVDERFSAEGSATDASEVRRTYQSPHSSPWSASEVNVKPNAEVYHKLQQALTEAENLKYEAYQEWCRRRKAERNAVDAIQKARAAEILSAKEVKQRKEIEEKLARERLEIEMLKNQLEVEHAELQQERDNAVREAEELRHKDRMITNTHGGSCSEFSYLELGQATRDFCDSLKMGEGNCQTVYKGLLRNTTVAIKFLNPESHQGWLEFYRELDLLSKVRHPNVVTLIGACTEACALIYEFLPNGSLEDHLPWKNKNPPLTWQVRSRIAAEICSALIFLHSHQPHPLVHGDLNPDRILLDANFISKLSSTGFSRLLGQSKATSLFSRIHTKNTFGYTYPEFITSGELTPHSDIYSLGAILLLLLTGRSSSGIIKEVKEAVDKGYLNQLLDASAGDWPFIQAKQLAYLGLRCCETNQKNHPDLAREVWPVLERIWKSASSMSTLSFESVSDNDSCIPNYFICPIFQEIMRDPQVASDGFTYEAEALKGWFGSGHDTSPMTNLKLPHCDLIPNHALRSAIQEWMQQQQQS